MLNKEGRMKEAEHFANINDAYIHVEMKNGQNCEIIIAGDGLALIHAVGGIIERLGQLNNTSFENTIEGIKEMRDASIRNE